MLDAKPIERPDTLKDLAYKEIKNHLTAGHLAPETVYSANRFAEMLKVSRTPVREALLQLAAEGYLEFIEGRGFRVKQFTEKEIRDFFEVRRLIETYVAEKLADTLTNKDLKAAETAFHRMEQLARAKDTAGFLDADREFHLALVRRLENPFLESIANHIRDRISVFALKALTHAGRSDEVLREHREILDALRSGDRKKAVRVVREHLVTTERYVLDAGKAAP
jgi:DNA-binding GntR family transcriptional regulator